MTEPETKIRCCPACGRFLWGGEASHYCPGCNRFWAEDDLDGDG